VSTPMVLFLVTRCRIAAHALRSRRAFDMYSCLAIGMSSRRISMSVFAARMHADQDLRRSPRNSGASTAGSCVGLDQLGIFAEGGRRIRDGDRAAGLGLRSSLSRIRLRIRARPSTICRCPFVPSTAKCYAQAIRRILTHGRESSCYCWIVPMRIELFGIAGIGHGKLVLAGPATRRRPSEG
jgi:hypothetical protein